jgi:hypothetical protein
MDTEMLKRLESLEKAVATERQKTEKGMMITLVVYGLLVLFVIGYTTYIKNALKSVATPESVAALLSSQVEDRIPQLKEYIKDNAKTQAPIWAAKAVDYTIDMIPQLESIAKDQIDVLVVSLISQFRDEYMPDVVKFCTENLDIAFKNADIVSDEEMAKAVSGILVEELEREVDNLLTDKFFFKMKELRKEIDKIATTPDAQMNRRELAEKRVILYWTFLVNHAEIGESRFLDMIRFASFFTQAFEDLHIDLDKEKIGEEEIREGAVELLL